MERLLINLQSSVVGRIDKIEEELKTHKGTLTRFDEIEEELRFQKEQIANLQTKLNSVQEKCGKQIDSVKNTRPVKDLANRKKSKRSSSTNDGYSEGEGQSISIN